MNDYIEYVWRNPKDGHHAYIFPVILKIIKKLNLGKDLQVLDAGCGGGGVIGELNKLGYKNLWGFDASSSGISIAKKQDKNLNGKFEIHNAYVKTLPEAFPKNNYDIVLSLEIIEHLYNPAEYLKNINYWLKNNGVCIISTPYHGYLKNLAISILDRFDREIDPLFNGGHIKFFSKKTLFKILKDNGFRPLMFYGAGGMPLIWKSMIVVAIKNN